MSDIDELEQWQAQKEQNLARKAGLEDYEEDMESEEEVMGIEDEDTNWGKYKSNYYGGADDQGDESAQEDEEEEALKLQERMAKEMDEGDFLDDDDEEGWKMDASDGSEELEEQKDLAELDPAARLSLLEETYPEALLLAKELQKCKDVAEELEAEEQTDIIDIKKTALNSYMAMIYSYYALFTSQVQNGSVDLKEHPVMEGILKARELWRLASRLGVDVEEDDEEASGEEFGEVEGDEAELDGEELEAGSDLEEDSEAEDEEEEEESDSDSADEFTISMPGMKRSRAAAKKAHTDFDETADSVEQQARAKNKQSLRFYTSAIDKRNAPREDKFGGDLDLPYKERAFERRKRLQEEARMRGLEKKDRLGDDSGDEFETGEHDDAPVTPKNALYSKVKDAAAKKKADRQNMHKAAVEAAKEGRIEQFMADNAEATDKRAISYQIKKNRGITPKRAKINRNMRLKKRVRYEDAKKKLRGVRKEYKPPTGAYSGESTGIRKNVVHSTKF